MAVIPPASDDSASKLPSGTPFPARSEITRHGVGEVNETILDLQLVTTNRLGRFEIRRLLGGGGQGQVFQAYDPLLKRDVAVKVPRLHTLFDPSQRRRFDREARLAASLKHPHIVSVFDTGEVEGRVFLVTEYIHGPSLSEWMTSLQHNPLPCRTAAEIVLCLVQAVQYMHEHGIIHRDLKPSNVLLEKGERGKCENWGVPRITDFGLSQEVDQNITTTGSILGTVAYMAPEQASGKPISLGVDIYALGVILYELLLGQKPFWGISDVDLMREIVESGVPSLRVQRKDIPRDLEGICQKCLAKSPQDRYRNASDLADDLTRFLEGKPTVATPIRNWERTYRWCKRHPRTTVAMAILSVISVAVISMVIHYEIQVRSAKTLLEQRAEEQADMLYAVSMREITELVQHGKSDVAIGKLEHLAPQKAGDPDRRELSWYLLHRQLWNQPLLLLPRKAYTIHDFNVDKDRDLILTAADNQICCWDIKHQTLKDILVRHDAQIACFAYSTSRKTIVDIDQKTVRFCDIADIQRPVIRTHYDDKIPDGILDVRTTEDLRTVIGVGRNSLYVLQPETGVSYTVPWPFAPEPMLGSAGLKISPDGRFVLLFQQGIHLWDLHRPHEFTKISDNRHLNHEMLSFQLHSCWCGYRQGNMIKIDLENRKIVKEYHSPAMSKSNVVMHYRKPWLATNTWIIGCNDGELVQLELETAQETKLAKHRSVVHLILERNQNEILSFDLQQAHHIDRRSRKIVKSYELPTVFKKMEYAFLSHGTLLENPFRAVLGGQDGRLAVWNMEESTPTPSIKHDEMSAWAVKFAPDQKTLASAGDDGCVYFWDVATRKRTGKIRAGSELIAGLAYSPDGQNLLTGSYDGILNLWDVTSHKPHWTQTLSNEIIRCVAFSPDGELVAAGFKVKKVPDGKACLAVWNARTGQLVKKWDAHDNTIRSLTFSEDSRTLYSASEDYRIKTWDLQTFNNLRMFRETQEVWHLHLKGNTLYSAGGGYLVTRWNLATGKPDRRMQDPDTTLQAFTLSPDLQTIVTGGETGPIRSWLASNGQELTRLDLKEKIMGLDVSPNGRYLAVACDSGRVELLDVSSPQK